MPQDDVMETLGARGLRGTACWVWAGVVGQGQPLLWSFLWPCAALGGHAHREPGAPEQGGCTVACGLGLPGTLAWENYERFPVS